MEDKNYTCGDPRIKQTDKINKKMKERKKESNVVGNHKENQTGQWLSLTSLRVSIQERSVECVWILKECSPGSLALRCPPSGSEDVHGAHHVLSTDGTLAHAFAALATRHHVATFQQYAVDGRVHADLTQVLLLAARLGRLRYWHRNTHALYCAAEYMQLVINFVQHGV